MQFSFSALASFSFSTSILTSCCCLRLFLNHALFVCTHFVFYHLHFKEIQFVVWTCCFLFFVFKWRKDLFFCSSFYCNFYATLRFQWRIVEQVQQMISCWTARLLIKTCVYIQRCIVIWYIVYYYQFAWSVLRTASVTWHKKLIDQWSFNQ